MTRKVIPIPARNPESKPNPNFVLALRIGIRKLWNGRASDRSGTTTEFICHTLKNTELRAEIAARLSAQSCYNTYSGWLSEVTENTNFTTIQTQTGRKRWMRDLIKEFS